LVVFKKIIKKEISMNKLFFITFINFCYFYSIVTSNSTFESNDSNTKLQNTILMIKNENELCNNLFQAPNQSEMSFNKENINSTFFTNELEVHQEIFSFQQNTLLSTLFLLEKANRACDDQIKRLEEEIELFQKALNENGLSLDSEISISLKNDHDSK